MNIEHFSEAAENTKTIIDRIENLIQDKQVALAEAKTERARLQSLILTGDSEAMTGIVDARALVEGIEEHLKDLRSSADSANSNHRHAEAELTRARAEALDVEGLLTNEAITQEWLKIQNKVDAMVHPFLSRLKTHEGAIQVLGRMVEESNKALGSNGSQTFKDGNLFSSAYTSVLVAGNEPITKVFTSQDYDKAVSRSMQRYEAPAKAAAHQTWLDGLKEQSKHALVDQPYIVGKTRA